MARKPGLTAPPDEPQPAPPPPPKVSSRDGKRQVTFWIDAAVYVEFQIAILRSGSTMQAVGNDLVLDWLRANHIVVPSR